MINKVKDLLKDQDFMHRYASVIFAGLFLLAFNILAIAMNSTFLSLRNVNRLIEAAFPVNDGCFWTDNLSFDWRN